MNFERGKKAKEVLKLGYPTYSIYRMLKFQATREVDMGFYIMNAEQTKETLKKLSAGELDRPKYVIEFSRQYEELENKVEVNLYEMHSCFIEYHRKKYFIKSHIDEIRKR